MKNGIQRLDTPRNEPVRDYAPGSSDTKTLQRRLNELASETVDIPCIVGGREIRTGELREVRAPHDHSLLLGRWHAATPEVIEQAIEASQKAWAGWSETSHEVRAAVFMKAAELLAGPWRDTLNASTMLGQSKTCFQAEIDAACELIDFWRFNVYFALNEIYPVQPLSGPGIWNSLEYRPLEGFVYAVSPFNFTSIGGNLPTAPALMGNVALWKPSSSAVYSNYFIMRVLEEAGLPPGVINFVPGPPAEITDVVLRSPDFAGVHYTGSTEVFQSLWRGISERLPGYRCYPRIVGETGGKDFIFAHPSADLEALTAATIRGAFEFQGQKCSAASRLYAPRSLWPELRERLRAAVEEIPMGDPQDFSHFMSAVINEGAFTKISGYLEQARADAGAEIVAGGKADRERGWFIDPTIIECKDPGYRTLREEIFGPVISTYVYDDARLDEALALVDETSPYALTGAVFAQDRLAAERVSHRLRHAAGNFYINDKPTGAVVGQQPFGGARASGTDDKAGSSLNLIRWVAPRTIKETYCPSRDWRYPHMG